VAELHSIPYTGVLKFVGRKKELTDLHEQLQQPRTLVISAVAGMGGVGKTELAIKYAREHEADYPGGICWLNAIEKNVVEKEIVEFASRTMNLKVPEKLNFDFRNQIAFCKIISISAIALSQTTIFVNFSTTVGFNIDNIPIPFWRILLVASPIISKFLTTAS
jgi:hypothetical protein